MAKNVLTFAYVRLYVLHFPSGVLLAKPTLSLEGTVSCVQSSVFEIDSALDKSKLLATNFSIDLAGLLVDQVLVAMVLSRLLIDETHHAQLIKIQVPLAHLNHGIVLLVH